MAWEYTYGESRKTARTVSMRKGRVKKRSKTINGELMRNETESEIAERKFSEKGNAMEINSS